MTILTEGARALGNSDSLRHQGIDPPPGHIQLAQRLLQLTSPKSLEIGNLGQLDRTHDRSMTGGCITELSDFLVDGLITKSDVQHLV